MGRFVGARCRFARSKRARRGRAVVALGLALICAQFAVIGVVAAPASAVTGSAVTINVPSNQPTIQAGIDAASNGDTVVVAPARTSSTSTSPARRSKSRARAARRPRSSMATDAAVVTFEYGRDRRGNPRGSRSRTGSSRPDRASRKKVPAFGSPTTSPTVIGNVVQNNDVMGYNAAGILAYGGAPMIKDNVIQNNCGGAVIDANFSRRRDRAQRPSRTTLVSRCGWQPSKSWAPGTRDRRATTIIENNAAGIIIFAGRRHADHPEQRDPRKRRRRHRLGQHDDA